MKVSGLANPYMNVLMPRSSQPAVGHFFSHTMSAHSIINSITLSIIAVFLDMLHPPWLYVFLILITADNVNYSIASDSYMLWVVI